MESLLRVVVLFVALAVAAPEMAFAQENKDYWASTPLTEELAKSFLSKERCYENENNFLGCIEAINSLLLSSKPEKILTNAETQSFPGIKEVVGDFQSLKIQNFAAPAIDASADFITMWKKNDELRTTSNASWKKVYKATKSKPLAISDLVSRSFELTNREKIQARVAEAINSYLRNAIDPHTYIASVAERNDMSSKSEESYVGVGSNIEKIQDKIVLKPIEGSPAQKSGLRYMDTLVSVDSVPVVGLSVFEISQKIRGAENTTVVLEVKRGEKTLNFKIARGKITTQVISSKLIHDPKTKEKVGYIKITTFMNSGLCKKFIHLAKTLRAGGATSLVLDLRNNGGGYVNEALCMAASYLEKDVLVLQQADPATNKIVEDSFGRPLYSFNHDPKDDPRFAAAVAQDPSLVERLYFPQYAELYNLYDKKPLVVILNSSSASASELLPGSLQSYKRVITVGERSFGKGTVQGPGSAEQIGLPEMMEVDLYKTQSRFHFATGESNQIVGINPDVEAYIKPNPTELEKFALREIDIYPNAIVSSKAPRGLQEPRRTELNNCAFAGNAALAEYGELEKSALGADYQLIVARKTASCL